MGAFYKKPSKRKTRKAPYGFATAPQREKKANDGARQGWGKKNRSTALTGAFERTVPENGVTEIEFPGFVPGNNGAKGLLRMSHRDRTKLRDQYTWHVMATTMTRHDGQVKIELTRYSTGKPMDFDNLVSTGKLPIDAIVRAGVLTDDNPDIIVQREYRQVKIKKIDEQKTIIRISNL